MPKKETGGILCLFILNIYNELARLRDITLMLCLYCAKKDTTSSTKRYPLIFFPSGLFYPIHMYRQKVMRDRIAVGKE